MSDHIQSVVPYGQCPLAASGGHCAFKTHAHADAGEEYRALTCPDHARLHAVVDHAYDFTMCNQGTFSVAESDVVGLKATHHLNPANKTPKEKYTENTPADAGQVFDARRAKGIDKQEKTLKRKKCST